MKTSSTFLRLRVFTLIASIFFCQFISAQEISVIKESTISPNELNSAQQQRYSKFTGSPLYKNPILIQVENLPTTASNGKVKLSIPRFECSNLHSQQKRLNTHRKMITIGMAQSKVKKMQLATMAQLH